ncbi:hypothetical protein TSAR_006123 [Trichomalopsis sarcophagae]|uniref:WD repeat-containing protein 79 n=1 Tax=Trichomalopsis sarcophagae TaxID=543379 RepID=A0A232F9H1_9HYME|nr:hypothetical protein TSAR_006123 [Trichomalopsis sarcophagae]
MSDVNMTERNPAEDQQQSQNHNEKQVMENTSLISAQIENFASEPMDVLETSVSKIEEEIALDAGEVNNLLLSFESHNLEENGNNKSVKVEDEITVLQAKADANIVVPEAEYINSADNENKLNKKVDKTNENNESQEYSQLYYDWTASKLICSATKEFKPTEKCENFTKGCQWAPDGTCILVPCEDFSIRIFELSRELYSGKLPENFYLPSFESTLKIKEGGMIYDTCWFPYMNSWDPSTCCFLSTSQGSPIHLWDAFTGQLRATYRAYNQVDEVEAGISVQFTDSGGLIWSGFKNALRTFDTDRPGRQINTIYLKKDFPNVTGLVSCIRENPGMSGLIAFGTYSKCIGLYKDGPLCSFKTSSGVTQIEFSPCGTKLYSSVRRGSEFLCWDLRNPGTVLYSLQNRQSDTNQRIQFSLSYCGEEIVSGGTDGAVRVWKIPSSLQVDEDLDPLYKVKISRDCVNGASLHKNLPILAVSTGTRICENEENRHRDNSVRFYWLGSR